MTEPRRKRQIKIGRDTILFGLGLLILIHEVFFTSGDRQLPFYVAVFLLGGPVFLRMDEARKKE